MVKGYKIVAIIFVLIVICAPSCGDEQAANREEAILNDTRNDLRTEFESDYLTEASLLAYEESAKQKLSDLVDYFNIMTDTSLDISFREKASEMIKNTFQSQHTKFRLIEQGGESGQEIEVQSLIKKGLRNELSLISFSIDSIHVYEPLHRNGNTSYSGVLKFLQNFSKPSQPEHITKYVHREVDFYIIKQGKIFGKDTLKIWNVRLGEIR